MGLDTVELLVAVERTFEIRISDKEAERVRTVRELCELVYARVANTDVPACRTQRTFHRLRRAARDNTHVHRSAIRPDTRWDTLMPRRGRRQTWERMGVELAVPHWPALRKSTVLKVGIAVLATASGGAMLATASNNIALAVAVTCAVAFLTTMATERWRLHFASDNLTVADTARFLAPTLPDGLVLQSRWTREKVRTVVRTIIIDHLNVPPDFDDDAEIVAELGAD